MKIRYVTLALAALVVSPVYAACVSPGTPPSIPDGSTASGDDMAAAQKNMLAFDSATNTYLTCIKQQHDAAVAAAGAQISTVQADKLDRTEADQHNAAVLQLNDVVNRFNQQMQAFKAKVAAAAAKKPPKGKNGAPKG